MSRPKLDKSHPPPVGDAYQRGVVGEGDEMRSETDAELRARIKASQTQKQRAQTALRYLTQHPQDVPALEALAGVVKETWATDDGSIDERDITAYNQLVSSLEVFQRITRRLLRPI